MHRKCHCLSGSEYILISIQEMTCQDCDRILGDVRDMLTNRDQVQG